MKLYSVLDVMGVAHRCGGRTRGGGGLVHRSMQGGRCCMPLTCPPHHPLLAAPSKYGCADCIEEARQLAQARYQKARATQSDNEERRRCAALGHAGVVGTVALCTADLRRP